MVVVNQHVLWTFFASLFGFLLLYTLRCNNNSNKTKTKKNNFPQESAKETFADGECSPVNGSGTDVIIVGAGVVGSALAYTLGKVRFFFFFPKKNLKFDFFLSFSNGCKNWWVFSNYGIFMLVSQL
jgi:hypothetical protein